MSYTHVIVTMKAEGKNKPVIHIEADLNEAFVVENIVKPYVNGYPIFVDGARSCSDDIQKIAVYQSDVDSQQLTEDESARIRSSSARDKANRIFSGKAAGPALMNILTQAPSVNITRKVINESLGIDMP
ncbi:hypothetical protein ACH7BS_24175 [Klebsiella aerogenes]|uniref:hypothetical protein n=1 Tax=Klebsiella aerogenes TaxID=548 RepID=UPI0037BE1B16